MELGNMIFGNSRGEYEVDRGWVEIFSALMDSLQCDHYGIEYENNTFATFPYFWGDPDCDNDDSLEDRACPCKPNCPSMKPNFLYKPTNYSIKWYKYPFRDSYANQKITTRQFIQIVDACIESMGV